MSYVGKRFYTEAPQKDSFKIWLHCLVTPQYSDISWCWELFSPYISRESFLLQFFCYAIPGASDNCNHIACLSSCWVKPQEGVRGTIHPERERV